MLIITKSFVILFLPGLGKRGSSAFDTLGGIGLGKRAERFFIMDDTQAKRAALSHFDTLGAIYIYIYIYEKQ
uniref:Uncharacterized protein n=1 Tax=Heterorhabditis bacteriophora TaxID=37862 RepID=A0A1I7X130_HETBA